MTSRIPCTPEAHEIMSELKKGLGADHFDAVLRFLASALSDENEAPILAGYRLREKFEKWQDKQEPA